MHDVLPAIFLGSIVNWTTLCFQPQDSTIPDIRKTSCLKKTQNQRNAGQNLQRDLQITVGRNAAVEY